MYCVDINLGVPGSPSARVLSVSVQTCSVSVTRCPISLFSLGVLVLDDLQRKISKYVLTTTKRFSLFNWSMFKTCFIVKISCHRVLLSHQNHPISNYPLGNNYY